MALVVKPLHSVIFVENLSSLEVEEKESKIKNETFLDQFVILITVSKTT